MRTTVIDGALTLFTYIDKDGTQPVRVYKEALLPESARKDWENTVVYVLDWKIEPDGVHMTYQTRNELFSPVHDSTFALRETRIELAPPTRSRNWKFRDSGDYWFNSKTGQEVAA